MASVRKLKLADGRVRWRVRVYVGRDPASGRRIYVTRTLDRKRDADAEAAKLEHEKSVRALSAPSRETLASYLSGWLANVKEGRVRARTLHDYRGMVRRYIANPPRGTPKVGSVRLDRLTPAVFESLYSHLWRRTGLSPRSLQLLHSIVRQAMGHAVRTGALSRNPTDGVTPPRQALGQASSKRRMRAMDGGEARRFLEAASTDRLSALWVLLLTGGLRPSEALGLSWDAVDLAESRVHIKRSLTRRGVVGWEVVEPKTSRARRVVVVPAMCVRALRAHRVTQIEDRLVRTSDYVDHGFVFATASGNPLDLRNVHRAFQRVLRRAGLGTGGTSAEAFVPAFRLYDLRHTCATLLLLAGENPKVVSERLGHASVALTLDTYSHVLPSMQEESARKLDRLLGGVSAPT